MDKPKWLLGLVPGGGGRGLAVAWLSFGLLGTAAAWATGEPLWRAGILGVLSSVMLGVPYGVVLGNILGSRRLWQREVAEHGSAPPWVMAPGMGTRITGGVVAATAGLGVMKMAFEERLAAAYLSFLAAALMAVMCLLGYLFARHDQERRGWKW